MIKKVSINNITDDFLKGFNRYQETNEVLYYHEGSLLRRVDKFTESWQEEKLVEVSRYLRETAKKGGIVYAAYSGKHVIGFTCIENYMFEGYINLPYIHIDHRYRGRGVGKELLLFIGLEALMKAAKYLYISAHPAVESQAFYERMGCKLVSNVNKKLLEVEPLDIQLELPLSYELLIDLLKVYLSKQSKSAVYFGKLASRFYRFLPKDDVEFLEVIRKVISNPIVGMYSIATLWLKRRKSVLTVEHLPFYEELFDTIVVGWGRVDQLCYRALNPLIESGDFYHILRKWSESDNPNKRRASLVAMVRSSGKHTLGYDVDKLLELVELLKSDGDYHVRKGVGWVLKVAYPTYPKQIEEYLRTNYSNLDRMIYRYALEHVKDPLRSDLLNLR